MKSAIQRALDAAPSLHREGDYCELESEDHPNGLVVFRRKDGTPFMWMPREDYEALREQLTSR